MIHHFRPVVFLLVVACLLAAAPGLRAGVLMIAPAAFQITDHGLQEVWDISARALHISSWDSVNQSWAYFAAPVYLPQGVVPKKMTLYCRDNAGGTADWVDVEVWQVNPATGVDQSLVGIDTTAVTSSPNRLTMSKSISYTKINNKLFNYMVVASFPYGCSSEVEIYGVKIEW